MLYRPKMAKAPCASATSWPPAASRCSTLGDGGLNFRVRNGIGWAPASMVALARGAPARFIVKAAPRRALAAAWRPIEATARRATCANADGEELGLLVALG